MMPTDNTETLTVKIDGCTVCYHSVSGDCDDSVETATDETVSMCKRMSVTAGDERLS